MKKNALGKKRRMKKFVIREIAAVDHGAQETARATLVKRKGAPDYDPNNPDPKKRGRRGEPVKKSHAVLLTTTTGDHGHGLHMWDDDAGGMTMSAVQETESAGAIEHSHPWALNPDGTITIGVVLGHDHEVDSEQVMAALVGFRKDDTKPVQHSLFGEEEDDMSDLAKITKRAEEAEAQASYWKRVAELAPEHRLYFETLAKSDGEAFLQKSVQGRDIQVAEFTKAREAANPVVYKSERTGKEYRQDQAELAEFAKRDDEREKEMSDLRKSQENAAFSKVASEHLAHLPGSVEDRTAVVKAIHEIGDAETRDHAFLIVKAADNAMSKLFKTAGTTGGVKADGTSDVDKSGEDRIEEIAQEIRKAEPKLTEAEAYTKALGTEEGRRIYGEIYGA